MQQQPSSFIKASLSPNPAKNMIKISLDGLKDGQVAQLLLKNINGQVVLQKQLTTITTRLDIDHLNKGIYLYEIRTNKEQVTTGKLIIQ